MRERGYPWALPPRHEHGPRNTSAHPRHLEIGARITYGNSHPSFDHDSHGHSLSIPASLSCHPPRLTVADPLPGDGRLLLPSSTWASLSSPSSFNHRPPFLPRTRASTYLALGLKIIIIAILWDKKFTLAPRIGPSLKTVRAAWRLRMVLSTNVPLPDRDFFWSGPYLHTYLVVSTCDCQSVA